MQTLFEDTDIQSAVTSDGRHAQRAVLAYTNLNHGSRPGPWTTLFLANS